MDSLITQILQLSNTEKDLELLANKKLKDAKKTLSKNRASIDSALDTLNPQTHTLGYIIFLSFQATQEHLNIDNYVKRTREFLNVCDPNQVALAPRKFALIACKFGDLLFEQHPTWAIKPLRTAITKVQAGDPHLLTGIHPVFVLCCIKARCYHSALSVIDHSIYKIERDDEDDPLTPKDNLLYHYYAAVCYIAFKNFDRAQECLLAVLTAPSSALSAIQVEAYKKYALVSLILCEKIPELPRFTSPHIARHVEKLCQPYSDLAEAYGKGLEHMDSIISPHSERFLQEENFGLIKQLMTNLTKRNIKKLTDTYVTLSLENIAKRVGLQDATQAESMLVNMIEDGEISAQIDQKKGMVSFLDDDEDYATQQTVQRLDRRIQEVMMFRNMVDDRDKQVALHPSYITKTLKSGKGYDTSDDQDLLLAQQASLEMEHSNAMVFA